MVSLESLASSVLSWLNSTSTSWVYRRPDQRRALHCSMVFSECLQVALKDKVESSFGATYINPSPSLRAKKSVSNASISVWHIEILVAFWFASNMIYWKHGSWSDNMHPTVVIRLRKGWSGGPRHMTFSSREELRVLHSLYALMPTRVWESQMVSASPGKDSAPLLVQSS
jgi:hypothetical protein